MSTLTKYYGEVSSAKWVRDELFLNFFIFSHSSKRTMKIFTKQLKYKIIKNDKKKKCSTSFIYRLKERKPNNERFQSFRALATWKCFMISSMITSWANGDKEKKKKVNNENILLIIIQLSQWGPTTSQIIDDFSVQCCHGENHSSRFCVKLRDLLFN